MVEKKEPIRNTPQYVERTRRDPFGISPKKSEESEESFFAKNLNLLIIIFGVLSVGVVLFVAMDGSITGAAIAEPEVSSEEQKQASIEERLKEIDASFASVGEKFDQCNSLSQKLAVDIKNLTDDLNLCDLNTKSLEAKNIALQTQVDTLAPQDIMNTLQNELLEKREKVTSLEERYDKIINNAARTICCKKRVDDQSIDSYIIGDLNIHCVHNGDEPLNC